MKKQVTAPAVPRHRPLADSVERTLAQIGDSWSFLILREAFFGERRFQALQQRLNAAPSVLTDRLRKLVAHGILEKRAYSERPPRYEYHLTEKGLDVYPAIVLLMRWGDRWLADDNGPPLDLVHQVCGKHTLPVLVCNACGEPIKAREMTWRPGTRQHDKPSRRGAGTPV
jgi:DNA-binding HxlR family transcriptional regulator